MGIKNNRAVFFSIDALVAIGIVLVIILITIPTIKFSQRDTEIHRDILNVLSSLTIEEIDNSYVQALISSGQINDTSKSLLEQIGEFYITDKTLAQTLASQILTDIDSNKNFGIWYGPTLIYTSNLTPIETADNIQTARQIISGIKEGSNITGFSVRASLSSSLKSDYYYLGGYIGDGNISVRIEYDGTIDSAEMELATNKNFDLYINNILQGSHPPSPNEFTPATYIIPTTNFTSGVNTLEIRGDYPSVSGGFIKILYQPDDLTNKTQIKYFPGISGLINIYDGFYIPDQLNSLEISLHLETNYTAFLNIGNTTVFNGTTAGEQTITLNNTQLFSLLDYSSLVNKTIPLRLGLENVSLASTGVADPADVISVTDLSGSMGIEECVNYAPSCEVCDFKGCHGPYSEAECIAPSCGGTWSDPIEDAKEANTLLIDALLNNSQNRVGLVRFKSTATLSHILSNNNVSLQTAVASWSANGGTCICCGVNTAVTELTTNSNSSKLRSMIVMSDGVTGYQCSEQGTGDDAQDAIKAAQDACLNENITVYSVGFGSGADEATLQNMVACGGAYYFANVGEISDIYSQISEKIVEATYLEQTLNATGDIHTILHPDSFVKFSYPAQSTPFGLPITTEKKFDNDLSGTFEIPDNSTLVSTTAISYSGPRWTDNVEINDAPAFKIADYGQNYVEIGDPYSITIPNSLVQQNNTIEITTGVSPINSSVGSASNKIIYTIVKDISAYSTISPNVDGCLWNIQFEDDTNLSVSVPTNYSGSSICDYTSSSQQHDDNDATQNAVFDLLQLMDLNSNNKIESKFAEQNLQIELNEITGIPYSWSTEVQVRTWY